MERVVGPFAIIFGEEEYLIDRFVQAKKTAWKKRHIVVRDGGSLNENELINVCETRTMYDDDGRAVILDNAQDLKTGKALSAFVAGRGEKDTSCLILVVYRGAKLPAIWEEASRKGFQKGFPKFKPWETQKVLDRIEAEAEHLKLRLEPGVAELIHKFLGDNLRSTVNELCKLTYLVGEDRVVTKAHIGLVLSPNIPVEPYHVADAAISKNRNYAMSLMSLVYKELGEGACVPVTSALMRQVEKTLVVRSMLDQGDGPDLISVRLGVHEFVCKKNLIPVAQKHSVKSLIGHMNKLCKLDAQVKGAARSKRTLVELAVLSISA